MTLAVAIPDSALADESTKVDKTRKASVLARSFAIFGVTNVFIYGDDAHEDDAALLSTVLRYAETPQYLRKRLFPRVNELKYAGVVCPLQIPSHTVTPNAESIHEGGVRDGVVTLVRGKKFLDVGIGKLIAYYGSERDGTRITIQFKTGLPELAFKEIMSSEIPQYWGYETKMRGNIRDLLRTWEGRIILTSRHGRVFTGGTMKRAAGTETLVVFGSTDRGLPEMLGTDLDRVQNAVLVNFFPNQHSATVRLEEAVMGTLAILDVSLGVRHT